MWNLRIAIFDMALYSTDQMQGIKLTRFKRVRLQRQTRSSPALNAFVSSAKRVRLQR